MSVFSLETARGNPVTLGTVDKLCSNLGVTLPDDEKDDYKKLLAVFHDASQALMEMDGMCRESSSLPGLLLNRPQTTSPR